MSYTTIDQVAGMFPTFQRGTPQQKPSDALIQTYIDDVAGDLDAVLLRRFVAVSSGQTPAQALAAFVAGLAADAINVLEKANRYGAAVQLAETLATFGVATAREMQAVFAQRYAELKNALDARDASGRPLASGSYDKLFDPQARTETARPGLQAIAGGDQPPGQSPADLGSSAVFGKFDKRGT